MRLLRSICPVPGPLRHVLAMALLSAAAVYFILQRQQLLNAQIDAMLFRFKELKEDQEQLFPLFHRLSEEINQTLSTLEKQRGLVEALEQTTKRKNLIFFGVAESDSESDASLVKSIIEKRMRISVGDDIDDAIRINGDMRPRPILVKFSRWKTKKKVFYKKKNLPLKISVEEDLTTTQLQAQERLRNIAEKAEKEGRKVRWNGKQLLVDGEIMKF